MKNSGIGFGITKKRIQNHFTYAWWQYVLLVAVTMFVCNFLYTVTAYRAPEEAKVEWYYDRYVVDETSTAVVEWMKGMEFLAAMEELSFVPVGYDESYGDMQLMVWSASGEGDLYMLGAERFQQMGDGLIDLQPYIDSGALQVDGLDLSNGYLTDTDTGEQVLRGIPMQSHKELEAMGVQTEGYWLSVLHNSGNEATVVALINEIVAGMTPVQNQ